jgi:hypothetical protein
MISWSAASWGVSPCGWQYLQRLALMERPARTRAPPGPQSGSYANGIKLGKAKGGGYSKFRYLQFNNFAISTLFRA